MQVAAHPSESDLQDVVQLSQGNRAGHDQAPPDRRLDTLQGNLDLIDAGLRTLCHCDDLSVADAGQDYDERRASTMLNDWIALTARPLRLKSGTWSRCQPYYA